MNSRYKKIFFLRFYIKILIWSIALVSTFSLASDIQYPQWTYEMKIIPFDILYPFQTQFAFREGEKTISDSEIRFRLQQAKIRHGNTIIFYIDPEQSYETFVVESNFKKTLSKINLLVSISHEMGMKVLCYLNGLEVITVGANKNNSRPSMARNFSDWLQIDIFGDRMVWYTEKEVDWVPPYSEDAWLSPLSPWREFFKNRLKSLSKTGLDGVYIDATFLPGMDVYGVKWASKDKFFKKSFKEKYHLPIPSVVNWNSDIWNKFVFFRHEVIRDYLGELAEYGRSLGMVTFFESSSSDLSSGTYLANDSLFTISGGGLACSPEIEPEGDFLSAFRMSKSVKDANQNFPMIYLGWPESVNFARKEFSIALCHSGNYYPTPDSPTLQNAFAFMDKIRKKILNKRKSYQNTILVYPMRSKDYSFESNSTFNSYVQAFNILERKHIPFRIVNLETLKRNDLEKIDNIILAGAELISDEKFKLIEDKNIFVFGKNGTRNKWGMRRGRYLKFKRMENIEKISNHLFFSLKTPLTTFVEYYVDKTDSSHFFLFVYNDRIFGNILLKSDDILSCKVYSMKKNRKFHGKNVLIAIEDNLQIIEIMRK